MDLRREVAGSCRARLLRPALFLASLSCACGGVAADEDIPGAVVALDESPPIQLEAGQEIDSVCVSWTLHNDEPLYVSGVDMESGPGWHHSAWFIVPESAVDGDDGVWDCAERGFDWTAAISEGGLLFGQSTQARAETQSFAPGHVIRIPPRSRIVGDAHLLHAGDVAVDTTIRFDLHTIPEDRVERTLQWLYFSIRSLALPPNGRSRFETSCDMFHDDFEIHYVLPHYHAMGEEMRIEALGRDGRAREVFAATGSNGDSVGAELDPAFSMEGMRGLRFGCTFSNPTPETVGYGFSEEMCNFLAYTTSEFRWMGGVADETDELGVSMQDGVEVHEMPCSYALPVGR